MSPGRSAWTWRSCLCCRVSCCLCYDDWRTLLTSANVETDVQALGLALNGGVVCVDIGLEQLVWVDAVGLEAVQHVLGAEVGHGRVIDLDALETLGVQSLELLLVCLGQVGEELLVGDVGLLGVALAVSKSQVEVWCRRHGELALAPLLLGELRAEVLPLLEVWALGVLDLASADDGHGVLEAGLLESSNRRGGESEKVPVIVGIVNLLKALELLEETAKVDLAVVLSGADWANTLLLLTLDDVGNGLVLGGLEFGVVNLLAGGLGLGLLEVSRPQKRANVLGVERESRHLFNWCWIGMYE